MLIKIYFNYYILLFFPNYGSSTSIVKNCYSYFGALAQHIKPPF